MRIFAFLATTALAASPAFADCSLERGIDWTATALPDATEWSDIAHGNGLFVAVGPAGALMTSPDGIAWTPRESTLDIDLIGIAFGEGQFVAIAKDRISKTPVITSPDGVTWTAQTVEPRGEWNNIAHGDGRFVALSSAVNKSMVSTDGGVSWSGGSEGGAQAALIHADGRFLGVGSAIIESVDGAAWENTRLPEKHYSWTALAYGNDRFLSASYITGVTILMQSADGRQWSPIGLLGEWANLTYGGGLFAGTLKQGDADVAVSVDGQAWSPAELGQDAVLTTITYGDGRFVAVGEGAAAAGVCAG